VNADLTDPAAVLARSDVRAVIDPAKPVCIVLGLVLGLIPARQAREVVNGYADLVAPGSCVIISCGRYDDEALWKQLSEAYIAADSYNHAPGQDRGVPRRPGARPAGARRGAALAGRLA
jgi:S-adenosyl methyltransferase